MASSELGASGYFTNVSQYTAYAESRSLSVSMSSVKETSVSGWIVYESTKGDITMLNGSFTSSTSINSNQPWTWRNTSDSLHTALQKTDLYDESPTNDSLHPALQHDLHYAAPFAINFLDYSHSIVSASTFKNGTYSELALEVTFDVTYISNGSYGEYNFFHKTKDLDIDLRRS